MARSYSPEEAVELFKQQGGVFQSSGTSTRVADEAQVGNLEQPSQPKTNLLKKIGGGLNTVFGGGKIGEAIGGSVAGLGALARGDKDEFETIAQNQPSPKEVAGDVLSTGLTAGGVAGVGTAGKFASRVLKLAGMGAGISGGQALSEDQGVKDVAKSAALGGAVGAALPVAGAGLRSVGKQIELLPARFVNSALGRSKKDVLRDISQDKVDDFAKFVTQNKPALKSANAHFKETASSIDDLNKKVSSSLLSAARQTGEKTTIGVNNLLDDIARTPEAEGALLKRADIKSIVEKLAPQTKQLLLKPSLTVAEANKLRQLVDSTLGDRAFLGGQLTSDKQILKNFANTLRETVKTKAPPGTRELFSELSNEIRFRDALLDRIAQKAGNQVLSFGDFIGGGLGGIFGGGIPGAVAGVATRRAIESVPFKLSSAKLINALTKASPIIEQMTPAQQTAILNLFAEIFSSENKQDQEALQEETPVEPLQ